MKSQKPLHPNYHVPRVVLVVKNPPANEGLLPGWGRSPAGGSGNPLQYLCLENSMDRGVCRATVHRVAKSWTWLKQLSMHTRWIFVKFPRNSPFFFLGGGGRLQLCSARGMVFQPGIEPRLPQRMWRTQTTRPLFPARNFLMSLFWRLRWRVLDHDSSLGSAGSKLRDFV